MKTNCRKAILFMVFFFLLMGVIGCAKDIKIQYNNKSDIAALQEQGLSDEILNRFNLPYVVQTSMSIYNDIDTLKSEKLVQVVRKNKDRYYSVVHVQGDKYLFLLYEENQDTYYVIDGFLASTFPEKSFFENISIGMNREEIIMHDSSACIFENYSYHRFSDRTMLEIKYTVENNQYIVSEYDFIANQVSVLDYLLPKDFRRIE